ncbi:MAG: WYL domain-containing protein [marine benthic group bacterium]|jgi:proteasome accessory factor B|nr:WYL domain-containing protein [Gemmatimonadota bacterium]MCL7963674.1 WYL domain-containing protein [Candidatus Carthagonibacter metallireducens]MCL7938017.1 WYL domain-containing protein [Gemmatimonadota bacterium]MCL7958451.1 WYL domain-containing protein [Gemmatimonadota bacterium]MCL7965734.1 WYL domain-containing protein [Gemmatimonadota bacterium]
MADSAADVLGRILELLAFASRSDGIPLDEAAERLETDRQSLLRDLSLVLTREDYHPAGWVDDIRIEIGAESIRAFSSGKFVRPPALSRREALALSIALRAAACSRTGHERQELRDLASRLEAELATVPCPELQPQISVHDGDDLEDLRSLFEHAVSERRRCRVRYLSPDAPEPSERSLDPYRLAFGDGKWFVIGRCLKHDEIRVFRLDRVLDAEQTTESFEQPEEADFDSFVAGGRVFAARETVPVTVRYSPRVEVWVREKGPVREAEDGGVLVDFEVADPGWVVRHVLRFGAEAEVMEPAEVRELVVRSLRRQIN